MKLYSYFRSSASYRVRIALNLKGVAYEQAPVNLLAGEQHKAYRAQFAYGLIPAIEADGLRLTQSLAIVDYLDRLHPDPPLYPDDPGLRAIALSMALLIACDIHPLNNLRVLKYLKRQLGQEQAAIDDWYRHWISEGFNGLEQLVKQHGSADFCIGDRVSIADICLVPQMWNARRLETDLTRFPTLCEIDEKLRALAPFEAAAPANQPDAPPA